MRKLDLNEVETGMITAGPITTPLGEEIAPANTEITQQLLNQMKLYRVKTVMVEGDDPDAKLEAEQEAEVVSEPKPEPKEAPQLTKTHAEESKTHSQKVAASAEFRTFQIQYVQAIEQMKRSLWRPWNTMRRSIQRFCSTAYPTCSGRAIPSRSCSV